MVSSAHSTGACNFCFRLLLFIDYWYLISSCALEIGYSSSLESALLIVMFPEPRGCWHMAVTLKRFGGCVCDCSRHGFLSFEGKCCDCQHLGSSPGLSLAFAK